MLVHIGCDHAGLDLKLKVISAFPDVQWQDMGTHNGNSVDYPDYADLVCKSITQAELENRKRNIIDSLEGGVLGILICGSGQGMAIRANRYVQVRAALCWSVEVARLAREHNNANILSLSARSTEITLAVDIVRTFLSTPFQGGRHQRRVDKLSSDTGC